MVNAWNSVRVTPSVKQWAVEAAAAAYKVHPRDIEGRSRLRPYAHARQYAMWLLRQRRKPNGEGKHGFADIGRAFGRDHTTVVHAINAVEARMANGDGPTPFTHLLLVGEAA